MPHSYSIQSKLWPSDTVGGFLGKDEESKPAHSCGMEMNALAQALSKPQYPYPFRTGQVKNTYHENQNPSTLFGSLN